MILFGWGDWTKYYAKQDKFPKLLALVRGDVVRPVYQPSRANEKRRNEPLAPGYSQMEETLAIQAWWHGNNPLVQNQSLKTKMNKK